jgi:hypothetical protein
LENIFSISFYNSTYFSSILSISFHYFLPYFPYLFTIFCHIFHSISHFNLRKASWIVKRYGKYGRKDGKDMKNTEENSGKIWKLKWWQNFVRNIRLAFLPYFPYLFTIYFCIFQIFSQFNLLFFDIFHIISLFSSIFSISLNYFRQLKCEMLWKIWKKIMKWYGKYGRKVSRISEKLWKIWNKSKYFPNLFTIQPTFLR